jgi:hypothetical protein
MDNEDMDGQMIDLLINHERSSLVKAGINEQQSVLVNIENLNNKFKSIELQSPDYNGQDK